MPAPPVVQPMDQFTEAALVTGTVPGAIVNLHVNGVWFAWADASPAGASTRISLPRHLKPGDQVTAAQTVAGSSSGFSPPVSVGLNHVTYQFDNFRTGWNPYETALSTANVRPGLFGLLFEHVVDGGVYAQPLYVQGVPIAGNGTHNVVFVATEACTIYAFDADNNIGPNAAPLWKRSLLATGERPMFTWDTPNNPTQVKPSPNPDWSFAVPAHADLACGNIYPLVGITSTPVIDRTTNTLFAAAKTYDGANFHWRLHAIDITSGADRATAASVEITASVPGSGDGSIGGAVPFLSKWGNQRSALLLSRGIVYLAFASHCDWGPPTTPNALGDPVGSGGHYHGWVIGYEADTLQQVGTFCATPDGVEGGIWNAGYGPPAGPDGFIYAVTGNGDFSAGRDFGDSVVQLGADLSVANYFTPHDQSTLYAQDWDLGSGGAMVLPNQPTPAAYLVVAAGKTGTIYVMDPTSMGGFNAAADSCRQHLVGAIGNPPGGDTGMYGGPGFYQGLAGQVILYAADGDNLKAFPVVAGTVAATPTQSVRTFPSGGAVPATTSNGSGPGSGVVWLMQRNDPLTLVAIDAANVSAAELFSYSLGNWVDAGSGRFVVPTAIHGKVYCAISILSATTPTTNVPAGKLSVFGHLPKHKPEKWEKNEKYELIDKHVLVDKNWKLEIEGKQIIPKELKESPKEIKEIVEGPGPFGGEPVEARVSQLERSVEELRHFVRQELRPDLRRGALTNEGADRPKRRRQRRTTKRG